MAALDNIYSGYEINKNLNPSYTGPLFEVWSRDSGSLVTVSIEQDSNGEPDLVKFQNEQNLAHDWAYDIAYDPWGGSNWDLLNGSPKTQFEWDEKRYGKFWDSATQSFSTDANGNLIIPKREGTGSDGAIPITDLPLNQYSAFIRHKINNPTGASYQGLFGTKDTVIGRVLNIQENGTDPVDSGMGSPSYYKDGVLQSLANEGDAWTAYANEPVNVIGVVNFDLNVGRTNPETLYFFAFSGSAPWVYEYHTGILVFTGDVGTSVDDTQVTEIQALLEDTYDPILTPKVTFTDEVGSPIVGGHVLWIEETAFAADSASWNSPVIVESTGTTDANGEVTYGGTVDPAKVYTAVLRDYDYVSGSWVKSQGSDTGQQNVDLTAPA